MNKNNISKNNNNFINYEKDFKKILDDLYEQTHVKEFYIMCSSEEIKKELENLDINYKYDVILEPNIRSVTFQEDTFIDNNKIIYIFPTNELKDKPIRVISEPVDMPIEFLCKGEDFYDFM